MNLSRWMPLPIILGGISLLSAGPIGALGSGQSDSRLTTSSANIGGTAPVARVTAAAASPTAASSSIAYSNNFAGYLATTPSGATTVSARITVPTVTCPAGSGVTIYPAMQWSGSAGMASGAQVSTCSGGSVSNPTFQLALSPNGKRPLFALLPSSPGDSLSVTITYTPSNGRTTVVGQDITSGLSANVSGFLTGTTPAAPRNLTVGTIVSGPGSPPYSPLPRFSTITYSGVQATTPTPAGTVTSTLASMNPTRANMFNGTTLQVSATAIDSTGRTFATVWNHA